MTFEDLGPFDEVLDVGGNVGEFAELCRQTWPAARVTSFEPLPEAVKANRRRANGRWWVEEVAVSAAAGVATLHFCTNQHSVSTLQEPGALRAERFGIRDRFVDMRVRTDTLDHLVHWPLAGRTLLKVDVEGHELAVFAGADRVLSEVAMVVCEVNQSPKIFVGAPAPSTVDELLRRHGLFFAGVIGVQHDPQGCVVQFDGVWLR